jgi:hypothetical protein
VRGTRNRNQFSSFMKLARRQPEIRIRLITVSPPPHDRFVATRTGPPKTFSGRQSRLGL